MFGLAHSQRLQERLGKYLKSGRVHPALIFSGPNSANNHDLARKFAQALLCPRRKSSFPFCGICSSCRRAESGLHPDLLLVQEPEEEVLKIELVRQVCHEMTLSPLEADAKVCLVMDCHRLNAASANAFLKTLEEPADGRYFLLLTPAPAALLPTVLSRCLHIRVPPESVTTTPDLPSGDTLTLFDKFLVDKNPHPLVAKLDEKETCQQFLRYLQSELRKGSLRTAIGAGSGHFPTEPEDACLQRFQATLELEGRLRSNANYGLMLESFLRENF